MKTERHNFDLGDIVTVYNQTYSGKFQVEGRAAITKIRQSEDQYEVQFLDDIQDFGASCTSRLRYVDPNGQENPEAYLAYLNRFQAA
jgi:hypothetical protein